MLVFHDYECPDGHRHEAAWHRSPDGHPPRILSCPECGADAQMIFVKANLINNESRLYGRFDPQYGKVVESYSHKRQLQREMGLMDADDPVKGDRERLDDGSAQTEKPNLEGVKVASSLADLGIDGIEDLEPVDPE